MKTASRALLAVMALATLAQAQTAPTTFAAALNNGAGTVLFNLSADGKRIDYRIAGTLRPDTIFSAHVHLGEDESSQIVANLHGPFLPPADVSGPTAQGGAIEDGDVIGTLAGQGVAGLVSALLQGTVSVHVIARDPAGGAPVMSGNGADVFGRFHAQ